MRYISTRGQVAPVAFLDATLMGLADDGGLLIPERIPDVRRSLKAWGDLEYPDLALEVLRLFIDDVPASDLESLVRRTYRPEVFPGGVAPLVSVGDLLVLELWHGPTLAFKDVALQLLGNLFEYVLGRRGGRLNILGATSGDTGSAAIHGVRGRRGIDIFMMHPHGRISPIQERQMTSVPDANVHNLAIEGSFDDCQSIMKQLAGELEFKRRYSLGAVNSVNWARVLPQIVYYFHAVLEAQRRFGAAAVDVAVPTGNFGDILAGWYARQMGLPIERLILASNENNILSAFFNTGLYRRGQAVQTLSPSMDIQVASNFERYLYYLLGSRPENLRQAMADFARQGQLQAPAGPGGVDPAFVAGWADRRAVLETIARFHKDHAYLADPHTAVGLAVAEKLRRPDRPVICLATAHPAKFPEAIRLATGQDLARHPLIDALADLATRKTVLPNSADAVREFLAQQAG
jgi:threonine synthase